VVVTDTERGAALARSMDALVMPDPGAGLNSAVSLGLDAVASRRQARRRWSCLAMCRSSNPTTCAPSSTPPAIAHASWSWCPTWRVGDQRAVGAPATPHRAQLRRAKRTAPPRAARRAGEAIRLELPRLALDIDDESRLSMLEGEMLRSH